MSTTIQALLLLSLVQTDDPRADAWESVDHFRAMVRDHDLSVPLTDTCGRGVIDCLPGYAWEGDEPRDAYYDDDEPTIPAVRVRVAA